MSFETTQGVRRPTTDLKRESATNRLPLPVTKEREAFREDQSHRIVDKQPAPTQKHSLEPDSINLRRPRWKRFVPTQPGAASALGLAVLLSCVPARADEYFHKA